MKQISIGWKGIISCGPVAVTNSLIRIKEYHNSHYGDLLCRGGIRKTARVLGTSMFLNTRIMKCGTLAVDLARGKKSYVESIDAGKTEYLAIDPSLGDNIFPSLDKINELISGGWVLEALLLGRWFGHYVNPIELEYVSDLDINMTLLDPRNNNEVVSRVVEVEFDPKQTCYFGHEKDYKHMAYEPIVKLMSVPNLFTMFTGRQTESYCVGVYGMKANI